MGSFCNEGARVERLESELWCATKTGWAYRLNVMAKILFYLIFQEFSRADFQGPQKPGKDRHSTPDKPPGRGLVSGPLHTFLEALLHQCDKPTSAVFRKFVIRLSTLDTNFGNKGALATL